jgi:hypothetical protein
MFGGRSTPLSERSNKDLAVGIVWFFVWTLAAVAILGGFLYQCGFRGDLVPLVIVWLTLAFFLWIGLGAIWTFAKELWRRRRKH